MVFCAGTAGAARRDQVIDEIDPIPGADAIRVDLQSIGSIFKFIFDRMGGVGQLASLADGDETRGEFMRHRPADYETPRIDSRDPGDLHLT